MNGRWIGPASLSIVVVLLLAAYLADVRGTGSSLLSAVAGQGESHFTNVTPGESLDVRIRGEVEFGEDDREIRRISPGGQLRIEHRRGLTRRRLIVEHDETAGLRYTYHEGRRRRDFDGEARGWLAALLPGLIRESGVGARQRVGRILKHDGLDGVLDEIDAIGRGSVTATYCRELLDQTDLPDGDRARVVRRCGDGIASSGDKARFLIDTADRFLSGDRAAEAFFDAVDTIRSSGDHSRVLTRLAGDHDLDAGRYVRWLESAAKIRSSGDKASVLTRVAGADVSEPAVRRAFFDAADTIRSSGDRSRVLTALLKAVRPDAALLARLCRSTRGIASSGDKAGVLVAAAPHYVEDDAVREACFDAADSIPSSGDRSRVLLSLLDEAPLASASLQRLFRSVGGIASSGDKARVLVRASTRIGDDAELREAYLSATGTIRSSGDRDRARSAVLR